jgi:hypothetical protein
LLDDTGSYQIDGYALTIRGMTMRFVRQDRWHASRVAGPRHRVDPSYVPTIPRRVSALARMIVGPPDAPRRREADVPEGFDHFDAK